MSAEKSVIGAILLDNSVLDSIGEMVRPEDFESGVLSRLYRSACDLVSNGKVADLVTLKTACPDVPAEMIAELTSVVPSSANAKYYAEIVHNYGVKRNAIRVLRETLEKANELQSSTEIVEYIESRVFDLHDHIGGQYVHVRDLLRPTVDELERRYKAHKAGDTIGVASGLLDLDRMTGGFRDEDLIVIGARASIGKTALGLTIAYNVSKKTPCAFFSLEMSGLAITERLMSMAGNIHATKLRNGVLTPADFSDAQHAGEVLYNRNLWIYDVANARLSDVKAKARRLVSREGVRLIAVDYIGLVRTEKKFERRHEQIGAIMKELKQLARELHIPIIVLAQLNRQAEGKMPGLAELAESGNIEQDADVILLLHRDRLSDDVSTRCAILKARNGATGEFTLAFMKQYTKFVNYAE